MAGTGAKRIWARPDLKAGFPPNSVLIGPAAWAN
jgi:hypothetical protein